MANVDFNLTLSLKQSGNWIKTCPERHFFLEGPPGIGKSSIMGFLKDTLGDAYNYCYFDCASKDLGDIAIPAVDRDKKVAEYFLNAIFHLQHGGNNKPVVIMLDEFTKNVAVQNMLHTLLEPHNPRLGNVSLPDGSIVFITGNLASNGVGDHIKGHSLNRLTRIRVRSPNADEWIEWAVTHDIEPVVMAWVKNYPECLSSDTSLNKYGYDPKRMQDACVTPRSLEGASKLIKVRHLNDHETLTAVLAGTIGEAAARDMEAYIAYQDQLPAWELIIKHPKTTDVPSNAGACFVMAYRAIQAVDKNNIDAWMTYLERFEPEYQAAFCINIAKNPAKQQIAFASKKFADWVRSNEDIL